MSFASDALQTKEAKEAIGEGVITWLETGNLSMGIDAMRKKGEKNGALPAVKLGIVLDVLKKMDDSLKN